MASRISTVLQDTLTVDPDGSGETFLVGETAWFDWLASASTFRYEGPEGHFTARKEPTSHGRGGRYWKAYRRSDGRLRRAYMGPDARLTIDRLAGAAAALAKPGLPGRAGGPSTSGAAQTRDVHPSESVSESSIRHSAHLRLLGAFALTDGTGDTVAIVSPRAQSLVAYLALHRDAPQSRRRISFLLWPESSEAQARNNLRQLLHQLRHSWPDADRFLSADANTLTMQPGIELDVDAYEHALAAAVAADQRSDAGEVRAAFERAAGLYHGELLPGSYDEWIAPGRERLVSRHQRMLDRLIGLLEQQGDYRAAIEYGQQRLRLDTLDERVYRWLMSLHALNQDRAGALRVYHACAAVLERELGIEPDAATRQAYERILGQEVGPSDVVAPPSAMQPARTFADPSSDAVPLIGRHQEWAQAMTAWRRMTRGEAHLILISGEAGIGKSRLAVELCDWASQQGIKSAATRAYAAEGRLSYAPAADWLRSEALASTLPRLDRGSLSEISRLLPELLSQRPDLPRPSTRIEDWQRQAFFRSLANPFLLADQPLVLVVDDLQWCDADTLEWLHFLLRLGRRARLLITGTVRPEEVDRKHPLVALIADLRESRQLTEIDLGPLDPAETTKLAAHVAGRRVDPEQARHIHLETEGNPLFVVETMRAGLVAADVGSGSASSAIAGAGPGTAPAPRRLPPKVQAVIAARLTQLSGPAQQLASIAATVGRAFTLEVVGEASGVDDDALVQGLDELLRRHIIREQAGSAYDFAHDKIREVAYGEVTDARRRWLHRRVAEALERVHAAALDGVAAQIAAHYANAGLADRAVEHYQRAAEVAQRVGANLEAISLLQRGLSLLGSLPPSHDRDRRELGLQATLGVSLVATEGYGAPEVGSVYARCRHLCQLLGRPPNPPILRALALVSLAQARIDECHALGDQLMDLAERADDPVLRVEAHYVIAMSLLLTGATLPARVQLEASLAHYDRARSATHIALYSQDPAVVCLIRLSLDLWILGDPEGAARRRAESLDLAEQLAHPFTLAYALVWDAILQCHRGNPELARTQSEAAIGLGRDHRMPFWLSIATIIRGWAVTQQGDIETGIDEMRKGMADFEATGSHFMRPFQLGLLAEGHGRLGNAEMGLAHIAEALALVERTNERWCEPELYRRKGDLLAMASGDGEAEAAYRRAVDVARDQGARALELRSATRLAEVWLRQERTHDVALLLGPIVRTFGSANDMPDLDHARALLGPARSDRIREPA